MSEAKHTPGPWRIIKNKGSIISPQSVLHAKKFPFEITGSDFRPCAVYSDGKLNRGTAKANAKLIAAAPDILVALIAMRDDWLTAFDCDVAEGNADAIKILADADKAITKAS